MAGAPNPQYVEPIPDSSIKGIKPTIEPAITLPPDIAAVTNKSEKYGRKNYLTHFDIVVFVGRDQLRKQVIHCKVLL